MERGELGRSAFPECDEPSLKEQQPSPTAMDATAAAPRTPAEYPSPEASIRNLRSGQTLTRFANSSVKPFTGAGCSARGRRPESATPGQGDSRSKHSPSPDVSK